MTVKIKAKAQKTAAEILDSIDLKRTQLLHKMNDMVYDKVFPLADTLQLDIGIYSDGIGNFELKGSRNWILSIVKNDLKFNTKIEASYVDAYGSAVLVHINKDFWIYAHYSNEVEVKGVLTLYYLDLKGQKTKLIKDAVHDQNLENALLTLRPLTKAKFVKGTFDLQWKELPIKVVTRVPKTTI